MIAVALLSIVLTWQGVNVFHSVLNLIKDGYGPVTILGMAVVAAASVLIGHKLTIERIRRRSLPL